MYRGHHWKWLHWLHVVYTTYLIMIVHRCIQVILFDVLSQAFVCDTCAEMHCGIELCRHWPPAPLVTVTAKNIRFGYHRLQCSHYVMDAKGKHSSGTLQHFETVPAEPKVVCYQGISHGTVIAQRFLALAVDFSSYPVYCFVTFFNNNNFWHIIIQ